MDDDRYEAEWPARVTALGDDPGDVAPVWAEHIQGASIGGGCWFLTQVDRLWRLPIDADPAAMDHDDPQLGQAPIPVPGVDHLGDCDVHADRLYVAMEGTEPAQIGWFRLDLGFVAAAEVPGRTTSCPWCAIDPGDGLLYTSPFDTDRLSVHRPVHSDEEFALEHVRDVPLRTADDSALRLERVQGGAFAGPGQLWLSSDRPDGGIHGIDVRTGQRIVHQPVPYDPHAPDDEVIEGLAFHDLRHHESEPWLRGSLHVLVLGRRPDDRDNVWFRHYELDGTACDTDGCLRQRREGT
jgi:hypothetical protein